MNGEIKVIALWKYKKLSANGAPFVYQCSELIDVNSDEEVIYILYYVYCIITYIYINIYI